MSFNEWTSIKLGELIDSISIKHDFEKDELIFLNTSDVLEGKVLHDNYSEVAKMPGQAKKSIQKGDILFSEIRPKNKRFAYIDFDAKDFVVSTKLMVLRKKSSLINNKFLYKLLTSDRMLNYLQHIAEGRSGTFPQITFSELKNIDVLLPSIQEQIAIAKTLDDLDEKIETNNKINKTLEEMAQAIFKQWFVDFEFPNEEGKPYKSSGGEMVESELGVIPKGWKLNEIYKIADVIYGAAFSSKKFNEDKIGLPLIRIRDLKTTAPTFYTDEEHKKATKVNAGDILVGMDAEFTPTIWRGEQGYLNQRVCMFKPNKSYIHNYFIYESIKPYMKLMEFAKVGTTVIHLGKSDIDNMKLIIPDNEILSEFNHLIEPLYDKLIEVSKENRGLINLRDTLLPKLMSGEIRVQLNN